MMRQLDNLVGKGLGWWIITQLITLNLAWMVTLAVPMAVLVATLMAFGSLSYSNEITVMKASGISLIKMMLPALLSAGILCYGLILFNNKVLPEANHRTKVLMNDIQRTRPTFAIEPGKFTEDIGGYNMLVRKIYPEANKLEGIFIIDNSSPVSFNTLTAEHGDITFSSDYSKMIINLYNGEIHQLSKSNWFNDYREAEFNKHIVSIDAQGFGFSKSDEKGFSRSDRELSADSMRNIVKKIQFDFDDNKNRNTENAKAIALEFLTLRYGIDNEQVDSLSRSQYNLYLQVLLNKYKNMKSQFTNQKKIQEANQRQVDAYLVEIYKKYSIPFACIVFVLIGAPLGVVTRKGSFGVASGLSLGFFLLYWACLIGGEKLADRELLSPFLSMWIANIFLGAAGIYLTFKDSVSWDKVLGFLKSKK